MGGMLSTMFNALGVLACIDCMLAEWLESSPGEVEGVEAIGVRSFDTSTLLQLWGKRA